MFLKIFGESFSFTGTDGKEYKLQDLTLKDTAKFVAWIKYKPYKDALAADLPKDQCEKIYSECLRGQTTEEVAKGEFKEQSLSWSSTIVQRSLFTLEGFMKLIELSFAKNYNINIEDVLSSDNLDQLQKGFYLANDIIKDENEDEDEDTEKN